MTMTTQYLPFATAGGANTYSYATYNSSAVRLPGYAPGQADAQHVNTVFRQTTVGVAGLAKFAADYGALDCLDDGSVANFEAALKSAIDALVEAAVPSGIVANFGASTAPTGWLECNGAAVSRAAYAKLFSVIGTTWGAGDGSTTFNLPDARGYVLRGWDHGSGVDPARSFATTQQDEYKAHAHLFLGDDQSTSFGYTLVTNRSSGFNQDGVNGGDYRTKPDTVNAGGSETRMKNIAVLICIKV